MRVLKVLLAVILLLAAGSIAAGKGGPLASGYWDGSGHAIYPDGTIVEITRVEAVLFQDGNFIYGNAGFTIEGVADPQLAQMSGRMNGNALKGVMGGCFDAAPDCVGAGIIEGKLSGNMLRGTVMDLSDGSTTVITLHRIAD
jgi:hypothetical protein